MATKIGIARYSYLDLRFTADITFVTSASEVLFPFYNMCFLVPRSKANDFLTDVDNYESYKYYKIKEATYTTKVKGELLDGVTRFYSQQHSQAELGILIIEDTVTTTTGNNTTTLTYTQLTQEQRLAIMNKAVVAIGRNAIGVGVAETEKTAYQRMIEDFRQCDSNMNFFKVKVIDSNITKDSIESLKQSFQSYGATILAVNDFVAETINTVYNFKNRPDFVIGGVLLNAWTPENSNTALKVGMALDGRTVNVDKTDVTNSYETDLFETLTREYITYYQQLGDDADEICIAGGGVYYQGATFPVNMFIFAKYVQYLLKVNLFKIQTNKNKAGVANATLYNEAITSTLTEISGYTNQLLQSVSSKSYTQSEINDSIEDKTVKLEGCITATTLPTPLFTQATFTTYIQ